MAGPSQLSATRTLWPDEEAVAGVVSWPGLQRYFVGRSIGRYLRPVPEHGIIYVKNPKAGCSTIMLWLDRLHTGEYDVEFSNIHEQHRLPKLGDVGRDAVVSMLSGSAFRFSFVRNPLRRLESVYWDKIVFNIGRWRPDLLTAWGLDLEAGEVLSFERFLSFVEQQDPLLEMDPHWRPQHINLMHPLVSYDHVGKLETFAADLEHIREAARLPHVPLETRNASKHGSADSVFHGRPDLIRRVEKLYEADFQLYGY